MYFIPIQLYLGQMKLLYNNLIAKETSSDIKEIIRNIL